MAKIMMEKQNRIILLIERRWKVFNLSMPRFIMDENGDFVRLDTDSEKNRTRGQQLIKRINIEIEELFRSIKLLNYEKEKQNHRSHTS